MKEAEAQHELLLLSDLEEIGIKHYCAVLLSNAAFTPLTMSGIF